MYRKNINSGTRRESIVGYSRAVRIGSFVFISGSTATDKTGMIVGQNDAYPRTFQAIRNIEDALKK